MQVRVVHLGIFVFVVVSKFWSVSKVKSHSKSTCHYLYCVVEHQRTLFYLPINFLLSVFLNYRFWPVIDDALRTAALDRQVEVRLLISWTNHSRPEENLFLKSLQVLTNAFKGVSISVVSFLSVYSSLLIRNFSQLYIP